MTNEVFLLPTLGGHAKYAPQTHFSIIEAYIISQIIVHTVWQRRNKFTKLIGDTCWYHMHTLIERLALLSIYLSNRNES